MRHAFKISKTAFITLTVICFSIISAQAARPFSSQSIMVDLSRGGVIDPSSTVQSPNAIEDRAFIELDLRVIVDEISSGQIQKIVDQGIDPEPAGCHSSNYNPLDMEDGLRYFLEVGNGDTRVRATIYPGERSRNPYNDVFCEFDPVRGKSKAVFRVRGYFFVRHSKLQDGIDIQLRPLTPNASEIEKLLKK